MRQGRKRWQSSNDNGRQWLGRLQIKSWSCTLPAEITRRVMAAKARAMVRMLKGKVRVAVKGKDRGRAAAARALAA